MNAWQIHEFGKPSAVLEWAERQEKPLYDKQIRVQFLVAPVNPADLNWIEGTYGTRPLLPEVPGTEGVAEVIESLDPGYQVGDRVIFLHYAHSWQQQRVAVAEELMKVPSDLPVDELAMLKVNPATAWCLLHEFVKLEPGSVIVQNAANSAVGRCVIQIAGALGFVTLNFVRRADLYDELLQSGANAVFGDDDSGAEMAKNWVSMHGKAAIALNAVGGESALRQLSLLDQGGTQVTYGAMGRRPLTIPNKFLIFQDQRFCGFWLSLWLEKAPLATVEKTYQALMKMIGTQQLQQVVDSHYNLSDLPQALVRLSAPERNGKILLSHKNW